MVEIYKKKYQTCLQALEEFRLSDPKYRDEVLSYAGVLDPMAEGVLPILVGREENQNRVKFTQADKEYVVEVLVGISTDTYDLLGIVGEFKQSEVSGVALDKIKEHFIVKDLSVDQVVPMFSTKKYQGKALWEWAKEGGLVDEKERPVNHVQVYSSEIIGKRLISKKELKSEIDMMVGMAPQGFRNQEVAESWRKVLDTTFLEDWKVIQVKMRVSKGFYVRKYVEDVSSLLNVGLCVMSLFRKGVYFKEKELTKLL